MSYATPHGMYPAAALHAFAKVKPDTNHNIPKVQKAIYWGGISQFVGMTFTNMNPTVALFYGMTRGATDTLFSHIQSAYFLQDGNEETLNTTALKTLYVVFNVIVSSAAVYAVLNITRPFLWVASQVMDGISNPSVMSLSDIVTIEVSMLLLNVGLQEGLKRSGAQ